MDEIESQINKEEVEIDYTNWRGETRRRLIRPIEMYFGRTEYYKDVQWLLHAFDVGKNEERTFAMANIKGWYRV